MGAGAKWWNGSAFKSISFPDSANVTKVLQSQGRFIIIRAVCERYYVTEPLSNMINGSGDMVTDGAAYVSAENDADLLVDGVIWQDRIVLGGTSTVEIHGPSGDDNAPWQPILGSTIHKGVFRTGCMAAFDNTFVWLSPDRVIWRYNGSSQPDRISNAGIEEALKFADSPRREASSWKAGNFSMSGTRTADLRSLTGTSCSTLRLANGANGKRMVGRRMQDPRSALARVTRCSEQRPTAVFSE